MNHHSVFANLKISVKLKGFRRSLFERNSLNISIWVVGWMFTAAAEQIEKVTAKNSVNIWQICFKKTSSHFVTFLKQERSEEESPTVLCTWTCDYQYQYSESHSCALWDVVWLLLWRKHDCVAPTVKQAQLVFLWWKRPTASSRCLYSMVYRCLCYNGEFNETTGTSYICRVLQTIENSFSAWMRRRFHGGKIIIS